MEAATSQEQELEPVEEAPHPNAASTYTVQRKTQLDGSMGEPGVVVWEDVGQVEVPQRSKRKKVLETAIADGLIDPAGDIRQYRVLDASSAEEWPVGTETETHTVERVVIG